jgi:Spy/CpxP family protein refolding chaperone
MKKYLGCICIVCAVLFLIVPFTHGAHKQKKSYEPDVRKWWERPKIVQKLNLSEEQLLKVREIYLDNHNQIVEERWNYRQKKGELEDLLKKADLDQDQINRQTEEVQAARGALEKTLADIQTAMMRELSPEQRRELLTILKNWKDPVPRQRNKRRKSDWR